MRASLIPFLFVTFVIFGLNGCGKIPTWGELTGDKKDEAAPQAPATPPPVAPPPVVQKAPDAAELMAKLKAKPPVQVVDGDILQLTNLNEGLDVVTEINADGSNVTKDAFGSIGKLSNLRQLRLNGTKITDDVCAKIAELPLLEVLAIGNTVISDVGVVALSGLANLQQLELQNCRLSTNGFEAIGKLPSLKRIYLDRTNLDNRGMAKLCDSKSLVFIRMNDNPIDDNGLAMLKKLDSLEGLEISGCSSVNGIGLLQAQKGGGLKNLTHLAIYKTNIGPEGGLAISNFKALEHLNIGDVTRLDDVGIFNIVKGMKNLKHLNLSKSGRLNGDGLKGLKSCTQIEELYIDQCNLIGDNPAVAILSTLKTLKVLNLHGTAISPDGKSKLMAALPDTKIN